MLESICLLMLQAYVYRCFEHLLRPFINNPEGGVNNPLETVWTLDFMTGKPL
jgi:hypothetical protein